MLDFLDFGAVLIAGMITGKIGDMRVGTARLVAGKHQLDDEDAAFHFLAGIHIWNILHQQAAGADLQIVSFITQPLEVGATIYRSL